MLLIEAINKHGLFVAVRGLAKHSGRLGGTFEPLKDNVSQKNAAVENVVKYVLKIKILWKRVCLEAVQNIVYQTVKEFAIIKMVHFLVY
jgi:hypothetical protein